MRTARDMGVPLSVGRGERRPGRKWLARDWALAQALTQYEAMVCDGCGHPRSESMNPEHDPIDPNHVAKYQAGAPFRCLACTELDRAQRAHAKALGDSADEEMAGLKWVTELIPRTVKKPAG